jgi:flagellar biosynthesis/type III secretory pathway protein FliH
MTDLLDDLLSEIDSWSPPTCNIGVALESNDLTVADLRDIEDFKSALKTIIDSVDNNIEEYGNDKYNDGLNDGNAEGRREEPNFAEGYSEGYKAGRSKGWEEGSSWKVGSPVGS